MVRAHDDNFSTDTVKNKTIIGLKYQYNSL